MLSLLRHQRAVVMITFLVILAIGLLSFRDYGISMDEQAVKSYGKEVVAYLLGGSVPSSYDWSFYGPAWPVLLEVITSASGIKHSGYLWELRHLLTFLLFYGGLVALYSLGKTILRDWRFALLGVVFLVLSPRVFAHSFYNPKDIPCMVLFIVSMRSLLWYRETQTTGRLLLHSMLCGLLVSSRIVGLLVPVCTVLLLLCEGRNRTTCIQILYFLVFFALALYAVWPMLWFDPIGGFLGALRDSGARTGGGFYFGTHTTGAPWHYLPVWITITTPFVYTILFLIGLFCKTYRERPTMLLFLWVFVPLVLIPLSGGVVFDAWRHVLFVYPAFLLIALQGLQYLFSLLKKHYERTILMTTLVLSLLSTGQWMWQHHPFQYVYFSVPSTMVDGKFELDYWGLSYRQGYEWILQTDPRDTITVYPVAQFATKALDMVPIRQWHRLQFTDKEEADYIVDHFRHDGYEKKYDDNDKVHSFVIDGVEILGVYAGPAMRGR